MPIVRMRMIREQSNEIAVMTAILDTRNATPLPHQ